MELSIKTGSILSITLLCFIIAMGGLLAWNQVQKQQIQKSLNVDNTIVNNIHSELKGKQYPILHANNQRIQKNEEIDPLQWVKVEDVYDVHLPISVYGEIDNTQKGIYSIRYVVVNRYGLKAEKTIQVYVD